MKNSVCKTFKHVIIAAFATLVLVSAGANRASAWGITWSDEFTGADVGYQVYPGTWGFDTGAGGWGNNELETYVTSQANCHSVYDGTGTDGQALRIEAQTDPSHRWYSARIKTQGKRSFGPYGYWEYRCKFPNAGKGYWPAAWFLGTNISSVGWPSCGEIDVAEEIDGQWENHQSLHMPGWDPTVVWTVNNSTSTYHNYGVWWQPGYITFNMDGSNSATWTSAGHNWPFDNKQIFAIINLAIGGNWPGNPDGSTRANGDFYVDYLREYH